MKKYIALVLYILPLIHITAQSDESESKISLSVILPDNTEELQASHISKIASKIQRMVTNYGISGEGYNNNFVIYPKYEIYDTKIVEGMKNVYVVDGEFNLFIKELKTGKIYNSYSQTIKGDGYSKAQAINQSIMSIETQNDDIEFFLFDTKQKIIDYYI